MELVTEKNKTEKSVRDTVYKTLKQAIISGELIRGTRIIETDFAKKMHVSRTPLRDAIRMLVDDGLLYSVSNKGVFVSAFTIEDVEEIYTIRNALEILTIPKTIENATSRDIAYLRAITKKMDEVIDEEDLTELNRLARKFHSYIINISGLIRVIASIRYQEDYLNKFYKVSVKKESRRKESQKEHHMIVDLIEKKDVEALKKLVSHHIDRSKQMCIAALKEENKLVSRSMVNH